MDIASFSKNRTISYPVWAGSNHVLLPCQHQVSEHGLYLYTQAYLIGGLSVFAFIGLLAVRPLKKERSRGTTADTNTAVLKIGHTLFEPGKRQITISGIRTELTPKENKLLKIFADSPGELIERQRIQKEIWEDEGVIVGRSLDVFISKLRKKLEGDASIQIMNVHGKGYRLQINDTMNINVMQ